MLNPFYQDTEEKGAEEKGVPPLLKLSSFTLKIMIPYIKPVDVASLAVVCKELKGYLADGWAADIQPVVKDLFNMYRQQQCFDCFVKGNDYKDCKHVFSWLSFRDLFDDLPFYRYGCVCCLLL